MPPPYKRHVFVCLHERPPGDPRGCCSEKGSPELLKQLKAACKARGLHDVRVNKAGCLDNCEKGISVVVYPDAVWYGHVTQADIPALVDHIAGGPPVERLRIAGENPDGQVTD